VEVIKGYEEGGGKATRMVLAHSLVSAVYYRLYREMTNSSPCSQTVDSNISLAMYYSCADYHLIHSISSSCQHLVDVKSIND